MSKIPESGRRPLSICNKCPNVQNLLHTIKQAIYILVGLLHADFCIFISDFLEIFSRSMWCFTMILNLLVTKPTH